VIVSSELDEIYALSDRIAVMYEGQIVGFCEPDTPEAQLGLMMAGVAPAGAAGGSPAAHLPGPDEKLELPGALGPEPEATSGQAEQP
jgi:simple sugar transport system ATP-binding protein